MVTEEEYRALTVAYERLQEDYEDLEHETGWKEKEKKLKALCREEKERNRVLSRCVAERERYIKKLEESTAEYMRYSEQYEANMEEQQQKVKARQARIDELEQWTGHLQALCDERLERIRQLEHYIHHPFSSMIKLVRIWMGKGREK